MTSSRQMEAIKAAKARLWGAVAAASRSDKVRRRERTPASRERFIAACRLVTEADDALESLGVRRG